MTSYTQTGAFKPVGRAVPKGPLRRAWVALLPVLSFRSARPSSRSTAASSPPRAWQRRSAALRLAHGPRWWARASDSSTVEEAGKATSQLGLTVAGLRAFSERHGLSGADVRTSQVGSAVQQLTREPQCSLCELLRKDEACRASVGCAHVFVSHAQSCKWLALLDALEAHLQLTGLPPRKTFFWIDIASIRQSNVSEEVRQIGALVRSIGTVLLVLDPWHAPVCLGRVWCLLEVAHCVGGLAEGAQLHLTMPPSERADFIKQARDRRFVEGVLTRFDARRAQASLPADRDAIFGFIESQFAPGGSTDLPVLTPMPPRQFSFSRSMSRLTPGRVAPVSPEPAEAEDDAFSRFNKHVQQAMLRALQVHSWQFGHDAAPTKARTSPSPHAGRKHNDGGSVSSHSSNKPQHLTSTSPHGSKRGMHIA